jgi:transcription-repair coupling factor (superfamily II helicase)
MRLQRLYPGSVIKDAVATVLVPRPASRTVSSEPLKDNDLLDWASQLIREIFRDS